MEGEKREGKTTDIGLKEDKAHRGIRAEVDDGFSGQQAGTEEGLVLAPDVDPRSTVYGGAGLPNVNAVVQHACPAV